jgi:hypothetical protein
MVKDDTTTTELVPQPEQANEVAPSSPPSTKQPTVRFLALLLRRVALRNSTDAHLSRTADRRRPRRGAPRVRRPARGSCHDGLFPGTFLLSLRVLVLLRRCVSVLPLIALLPLVSLLPLAPFSFLPFLLSLLTSLRQQASSLLRTTPRRSLDREDGSSSFSRSRS